MQETTMECETCNTVVGGESGLVIPQARLHHENGHEVMIDFKTYERKGK